MASGAPRGITPAALHRRAPTPPHPGP